MVQFNFNNSAYLLGAGASCDAGMPAIGKLGELIRDKIQTHQLASAIFSFAKKKIEEHKTVFKQYCGTYGDIDIEDVMSGVRAISKLSKEPANPFLKGEYEELWQIVTQNHGFNHRHYEKFRTIQERINFIEGRGHDAFDKLSQLLVSTLKATNVEALKYLSPLLDKGLAGKLDIFTLNYDDSIEYLVDKTPKYKEVFRHGFEELTKSTVPSIPSLNCFVYKNGWSEKAPCINLYKLHGSIDWFYVQADNEIVRIRDRNFPPNQQKYSPAPKSFLAENYSPAVVFGKTDKLRSEGVYLDLLIKLNEVLKTKDYLCVVGYPFRDPHINRFISRWMIDNERAILCIVTPDTIGVLGHLRMGAFGIRVHNPNFQRIFLVNSTFADLTDSEQFRHGIAELRDKTKWMAISEIQIIH